MSDQNGPTEQWHAKEEFERKQSEERRKAWEAHQKANSDKSLVRITFASTLVAVIAALAALWSGLEAHKTRVEDERPFVSAKANDYQDKTMQGNVMLQAYGKAPSLNISTACIEDDFAHPMDWRRIAVLLAKPVFKYNYMFPGEKQGVVCSDVDFTRPAVRVYGLTTYEGLDGTKYQSPFCFGISKLVPNTFSGSAPCMSAKTDDEPVLE